MTIRRAISMATAVLLMTAGWAVAEGAVAAAPAANELTVTNGCPYTIWIQQDYRHKTPSDPIVVSIASGGSHDYTIPLEGLASTRFWAKANCNTYGYDCAIGESSSVPSAQSAGQQTAKTIFDPGIDSKFEATWGCRLADPSQCAANPSNPSVKLDGWTFWDGSVVDGYTFAYRIDVTAVSGTLNCLSANSGTPLADATVDCSRLHPASCPTNENLSSGGKHNTIHGLNVTNVNLQYRAYTDSSDIVGCFSPCELMTSGQWEGWSAQLGNLTPTSPEAVEYCCPASAITPDACRAGAGAKTQYDRSIHTTQSCNAYSYAYDDGIGLVKCDGAVKYHVTYCPGGNSLTLPPNPRKAQQMCDPNLQPPQMCPGNVACPSCGRSSCPCP